MKLARLFRRDLQHARVMKRAITLGAAVMLLALTALAPAALAAGNDSTKAGYAPPGSGAAAATAQGCTSGSSGSNSSSSGTGTSGTSGSSSGSNCSGTEAATASATAPAPANGAGAVKAAQADGTLPFTGRNVGVVVAGGLVLAMLGIGLRRMTREERA
jgi:hypothetical protein